MTKRGKDDLEWQELKKKVLARDQYKCRLMSILTAQEMGVLKKTATSVELNTLDPAHRYSVSTHPELCYELDNVFTLNRFSHECLDNCKDPVTGASIPRAIRDNWWIRINQSI